MPWYSMNVTYAGNGFDKNYKRHVQANHSHEVQQQFVLDAKNHALNAINTHLPQDHVPNPVTMNLLGQNSLRVNMGNDPGDGFTEI